MANPIKLDDVGNSSDPSSKITLGAPAGTGTSAQNGAANGGGMGNIFTQGQAKKEESKMISSIISQKDVTQKSKSILGPAPTLEKSIAQEKEAGQKRKLRFYQFIFVALFVVGVGGAFYFYSELSPDFAFFGANTTQRLSDTNDSLRQIQTQLNRDNYLAAQLELNEFSYEADRFLSSVQKVNDPTLSAVDKRAIFANLDESEKALPTLLGNVRDVLNKSILVDTFKTEKDPPDQTPDQLLQAAQNDLRSALNDEKKKYGQNPTNPQDIQDVKLISNATKLVGNIALVNVLQTTSATALQQQLTDYAQSPDLQKQQALQALIGKILSSTKSDLATIASIKQARIDWSTVIGQIKEVTSTVDANFDQPQLYDALGGIVYNGYEFDTNTNKIVLSGTTKTLDGSNFTLMSNLIDHLENSQYFQNVNMRSFSKSKGGGATGEGYLANFKIDLGLETQSLSNKNTPVSLQNTLTTQSTAGAKRTTGSPAASSQESAGAGTPAAAGTSVVTAPEHAAAPTPTAAAPLAPAPVAPVPAPAPAVPVSQQTSVTQQNPALNGSSQQ